MKPVRIGVGAVAAWIVTCLTLSSCGSPQVRFIVPDGHRGYVTVVVDKTNGKRPRMEHGVQFFVSDAGGVIHAASLDVFRDWYRLEMITAKGVHLSDGGLHEEPEETVQFFGLGEASSGKLCYFIGTRAEYKAAASAPLP